ncbi:IS3 family transposase [Paenibacillus sp. 1P03SA]|uniref:IS3 family transposase n=1 Tax=Paenibacillus sp. 1P03SA TaxID=3132294 RepID=UPI0039A0D895
MKRKYGGGASRRREAELSRNSARLLGVSRSGFYACKKRKEQDRENSLKDLIRAIYLRYDGKYGYRQVQLFLFEDHGIWINHKKVLRLTQDAKG